MRKFLNGVSFFMKKILLKLSIILLLGLVLSACQSELYGSLSENQVNKMIMVLGEEGIDSSRSKDETGKFSLTLDKSDFSNAISILTARGLPGSTYESLGEVFKSDKIVSTPFEERARFMYALSQELAQSITQINGVVSSRVHITIPEETPFANYKSQARASVFIYYDPQIDVNQYVPVIKNLVTKSVDGLVYENVTVALFNSQTQGQTTQIKSLKEKPSGISPFLIFLIISGLVFFVLSKLIWKPATKETELLGTKTTSAPETKNATPVINET